MTGSMQTKRRIIWVDIFKALAITLMVIGHATGKFNLYIYQFHLSAFFFISGYVARFDSEGFLTTIIKKGYTLMLPLLTLIIINAGLMEISYRYDYYSTLFGDLNYVGFFAIIKEFFLRGSIYTWLLGAAWFCVTLFVVSIIAKLCWIIANKKLPLYVGYVLLIYFLGYLAIRKGVMHDWHINLALIANFWYGLGFVANRIIGRKLDKIKVATSICGLLVTTIIIFLCANIKNVTMDYISTELNNIWLNTFTSLVGIIWLYCLASLLGKIRYKPFIQLCARIGQNTMGVVLFHFIVFKMIFMLFYYLGIAEFSEIARLTPSEEISNKFWWLIVMISESIAVITWILLKKIPVVNVLIGTNGIFIKKVVNTISNIDIKIKHKTVSDVLKVKKDLISTGLLVICYLSVALTLMVQFYRTQEPIDLYFPTNISDNIVKFEDGWQPQTTDEEYRWIADKGTIVINSKHKSRLSFSGYVPDTFTEVTKLDIYVGDYLLDTIDISSNSNFDMTYDIAAMVSADTYMITFDFNGIHKPDDGSADSRELSGLIKRIYIE